MTRKLHTSRGWAQDRKRKSSEPWERGLRAPKKGNPSFKPVRRRSISGKLKKVYVLRHPSKIDKKRSKRRRSARKGSFF